MVRSGRMRDLLLVVVIGLWLALAVLGCGGDSAGAGAGTESRAGDRAVSYQEIAGILYVAECECGARWSYCTACGGSRAVTDGLLKVHRDACPLYVGKRRPR